ncbi:MAG: hypothetical protein CL693_14345 [Cellvibrionaceae bacterium]|nr:hypothetical protein [Cellvibrionaceae bacterium]
MHPSQNKSHQRGEKRLRKKSLWLGKNPIARRTLSPAKTALDGREKPSTETTPLTHKPQPTEKSQPNLFIEP